MGNKPIGILIDESKSLKTLLYELATVFQSDTDTSNFCYLPMWFKVTNDKIISYYIEDLPLELKRQIEIHRTSLGPTPISHLKNFHMKQYWEPSEGAESPEEMEDEITMQEPEPHTEQNFLK